MIPTPSKHQNTLAQQIHPKYAQPIAILGAGAIGQLLYHQLSSAAEKCYFIVKSDGSQLVESSVSSQLTSIEGKVFNYQANIVDVNTPSNNSQLQQTALLIVCVKSYQVIDALKQVIEKLSPQCHILLLHNGLGPHIKAPNIVEGRGLTLATTSQAALRHKRWQVTQTGEGVTQIGDYRSPAMPKELKTLLLDAIPQSRWFDDILPALWQKLAINAAINPLTAIEQCNNGDLKEKRFNDTIKGVVSELVQVAKLDGITLAYSSLLTRVYDVIQLTATNRSSMLQDITHHRKTEIESINGFITARAQQLGIKVPYNQQLLEQVSRLESIE